MGGGCWELNSGPLEEHSVLLTTGPSLQPSYIFGSFKARGMIHDVDIVLSGYEKTGIFLQEYLFLLSMKNINWIIKAKKVCVENRVAFSPGG